MLSAYRPEVQYILVYTPIRYPYAQQGEAAACKCVNYIEFASLYLPFVPHA